MRKVIVLVFMFLGFLYLSSAAIELESSQLELNLQSLKGGSVDYLESPEFLAQEEGFDLEENSKSIYEYKYKSPKKAFLYSLIVPGLGQRYAGSSIIKSIIFFGAEIGMWGGHFSNQSKGDDKTDEFMAYADVHWIEGDTAQILDVDDTTSNKYENYRGWLFTNYNTVNDDTTLFTEHLPSTKSQQYYEMIGKYNQFRGGWDDYWTTPDGDSILTPHRAYYMDLRGTANDYLDRAKTFITFSIMVHLVSAFDAAISANRQNKQIADDTWSVTAEMKRYSAVERIPMIKVTHRF